MSSSDASSERDPLDLLSEEFLTLHRKGEPVTVDAFCEQHPEHAQELRDLLETLLALEEVKRDRVTSGSGGRVALPALDRLGDFRIERELGRGGMGVVFEAVQEALDRRVALKVMPQASLLTENQLERFRREAQIAARLHHTNIVPVYGSGESDGYHWYAMQFIAGQSLDRWRQSQSDHVPHGSGAWRSRARFVARLGASAASALHAAHGYGTLHRDIKPANFLLDEHDHLWVTDFGLAKALEGEGLTHSGDLLGTLQYMAPEQFAGVYDVRSEIYALGVTLYELLTLKPAFRGRNRSELMDRVQTQRVEPLSALVDVPEDLVVIIEKAMAREPGDRYQDALELEQDLEAFVEDRPIQARRLSPVAMMWRWCRRNRGMAGLIAATMAAVLLAAITGWVAYGITEDALVREREASERATREGRRAETNVRLMLAAYGEQLDALIGREPGLAFEDDPDTGEQTVVVRAPMSPRDVDMLQQMLAAYDRFANENAESQSLRYETARAHRRAGAIHSRLGDESHLQAAQEAFAKALSGLAGITDRDVQRDVAQVHVDLAYLSHRLRKREDAREHLRTALATFEAMADANSPAIQLERAKVLFELSRSPGGRPRPGRPVEGEDELEVALLLVHDLLNREGENPEVLALQARCLREGMRGRYRRTDATANLEQALDILRTLVGRHPDRPEYRFELCETILAGLRVPGRRRGPRGREEDPAVVLDEIERLREADASAARLFAEQPMFREYRALHGRIRSMLGRRLHVLSRKHEDDDQRRALVDEAEAALRSALQVELGLVNDSAKLDLRFVFQVTETRSSLGHLLRAEELLGEAREQASMALDLLERLELRPPGRPRNGERPPRERSGGPPGRGLGGPPGRGRSRGPAGSLDDLIRRLDDDELRARALALRERLRRG